VAGRALSPLSILVSSSSKLALSNWSAGSISAIGVFLRVPGRMPTLSKVSLTRPPQRFCPYFLQEVWTRNVGVEVEPLTRGGGGETSKKLLEVARGGCLSS